jgi:hypothetical protein
MTHLDYFSPDYRAARDKFLAAARGAGARIATYDNPAPAPDGKPVHTDVACLGVEDAERVLLVNSATHGVEGFCGSGALVGWLTEVGGAGLPEGVRAVLIHAINPHGFAWLRRVTEDNVDLNRNFVDHERGAYPANPEYGRLHSALVPERWDAASHAACEAALKDYIAKHGKFALQAAVTRGQYEHADGLFFGGRAPTWSNRTFRAIAAEHVAGAREVVFLDFHTGLGPYGAAELIGSATAKAVAWFGDRIANPDAGNSSSASLTGVIRNGVRDALRGAEMTSLTVEFGTYAVEPVLRALQADNWLHIYGRPDSDLGREIKAEIRKRLYPDEDDWKELVWVRSRQVLRRAVAGLAASR